MVTETSQEIKYPHEGGGNDMVFNVPTPEECDVCGKSVLPNSNSYKDALDSVANMSTGSGWTSVCFHQQQQCNNNHNDCACVLFPLEIAVKVATEAKNIINDLIANGEVHECTSPGSDDVLSAASTPLWSGNAGPDAFYPQ
jgi:hypothetical protein